MKNSYKTSRKEFCNHTTCPQDILVGGSLHDPCGILADPCGILAEVCVPRSSARKRGSKQLKQSKHYAYEQHDVRNKYVFRYIWEQICVLILCRNKYVFRCVIIIMFHVHHILSTCFHRCCCVCLDRHGMKLSMAQCTLQTSRSSKVCKVRNSRKLQNVQKGHPARSTLFGAGVTLSTKYLV